MKKFRKVVVLGVLFLLLGGCIIYNYRSDFGKQQYASNSDLYEDREFVYF